MKKYTNENPSKKQRSTSLLIKVQKNESQNNNISEKENTNSTNINYKKGFHHRKRTSSYFLGSYVPALNMLENNKLNEEEINANLNIDDNIIKNNFENSNEKDEEITSNDIKNKFINNLMNNDNSNNNISLSFPSYDESNNNNNSVIIKQEESTNNNNNSNNNNNKDEQQNENNTNNNNIFYEMSKNTDILSGGKSFISFKNSLKYLKDRDERTTLSYQLALQTNKKNVNNNYVTASNIIEEEKSSMMESKSECSNKKDVFFFEKKKLESNINEKLCNILDDNNNNNTNINNNNIHNNKKIINLNHNNINKNSNGQQGDNNRMSLALNEIIIKNNKKEENRRKYLTKNKMALLNTFFTMSKTLETNDENNKIRIENYINNKDKYKEKDKDKNKITYNNKENKIENSINNNNINYYIKKKFASKFLKKSFTNKRITNKHMNTDNAYLNSMNDLNNNLNLNTADKATINNNNDNNYNYNNAANIENIINNNIKKNLCKIPHLSNVKKKLQQKLMSDSASNIIDTPFKKVITTNSNNNSSSRKGSHIKNNNTSNNDRHIHTLKRIENLNNALSFIREKKKISRIKSNLDKKQYINNNTYNYSNNKNTKQGSTSFLTNSNANTQSHSQSKEKYQKPPKFLRKANSGSFNSKGEYLSGCREDSSNTEVESNKNQTVLCLKYKLNFNKLYEKIDVLERINSTNFSNKSFFVVLCDNKKNQFIFSGLYKYYHDKERYIKIYGDERSPNYILLKDIKGKIKYKIFEDNNQINSSISGFIVINHFRFTNNAIIIIKN